MNLKERIRRSLARRKDNVILRSELVDLGSPRQLTRALSDLVNAKQLVKISHGVYAKTKVSPVTGNRIPVGSLEALATETLNKLGIRVQPGRLAREYNEGRSTQLPMQLTVDTGKRRITRRIEVGGRVLHYEKNFNRS